MASLSDDRIRELAQAVRDALERADKRRLPLHLQDFPHGSCGDSELLVAKLLRQHNHEPAFDFMNGRRGDGWHAWIQQGGLIVDISADQFDDYAEPVTVVRGSKWHEALRPERRCTADLDAFTGGATREVRAAYRYLLDLMPASARPGGQ